MHALINRLIIHAPEGYEVMYEATHHGPTDIPLPSCFIELGSTEKEWNDRIAARAVAQAVLDALLMDTSVGHPISRIWRDAICPASDSDHKIDQGPLWSIIADP
mgnify:CR=1 FL=1